MITVERRFVIQLHATGEGSHYDLMIESGPALATWRLGCLPTGLGAGESIPAEALGDHRREYLSYEGPVSGDRGTVKIAAAGRCRVLTQSDSLWRVELCGRRVRGVFTLRRLGSGRWKLSADAEPAGGEASAPRP